MKNEDKLPSLETCRERLHIQDELTYKELTTVWGIPFLTGKSRICQINNLGRFFAFEKYGSGKNAKYVITDIYDAVMPSETEKTYKTLINILLMQYLKTLDDHTMTLSASMWFARLGMYNNQYLRYRKNPLLLYNELTCLDGVGSYREDMFAVNRYQFTTRVERYYHQVFRRSLTDLQDKRILNFYDCIVIYDGTFVEEKVIDEQHGCYLHSVPSRRKATVDEETIILDIEKKALEKALKKDKYKTFEYLRLKGPKAMHEYYDECDRQFHETFDFKENSYYTHEITIVFSSTYLNYQIDQEKAALKELELNTKLFDWCNNNALTHLDYLKRNSQFHEETLKYYRLPVQHELADKCIKIPD